MPDFFHFISKYFWAVALAFSAFNFWIAERSALKADSPESTAEARIYRRRFAITAALPWAIMGLGQSFGSTPTVWHYFRPQDGNVFVIAWLGVAFILACGFAWWVFVGDGAKKVVKYSLLSAVGQRSGKPPSIGTVKLFAAIGVAVVPLWVAGVISMNVQLPI